MHRTVLIMGKESLIHLKVEAIFVLSRTGLCLEV